MVSLPPLQVATGLELPLLEMGFSSSAELLQRVPGLQVERPPKGEAIMVFSTWCGAEKEEEEGKKEEEKKVRFV